jgi:hypothetical protein
MIDGVRRLGWVLIPVISITALLVGIYANRFGADVLPDSGDYITGGIRLAHGEGYSIANRGGPPIPQTWFPPLISLVIAGMESLHAPIYKSMGIFDACCYALLVGMAGCWVWQCTKNVFWSVMAAAIVLSSHAIYFVNSLVLSEPLFLIWITASLWFLAKWHRRQKTFSLWMAGICISGALLSRYAGLSLIPAALIMMLMARRVRWYRKLAGMGVITLLGLGPSLAWSHWHTPGQTSATGRSLEWHPITVDRINDGVETLASFILPERYSPHIPPAAIVGCGAVFFVGAFLLLWLGKARSNDPVDRRNASRSAIAVNAIFIVVYLLFLTASISYVDGGTPLDERILSAVVLPLAVIFCIVGQSIGDLIGSPWIRVPACIFLLLMLLAHAKAVLDEVRQRQSPEDLAWFPTVQSDTLDALRDIPPAEAVWSDKPAAIFMAYRLGTNLLPDRPADPLADSQSADDYSDAIQSLRDELNETGGGWIVFWHQLRDFGDGFLQEEDVRSNFVIADEEKFEDGILLRIDDPGAKPVTTPTTQSTKKANTNAEVAR